MMKRFNNWLANTLAAILSSMGFFYVCVALDLFELPPVIQSGSVIVWCTYLSSVVFQLLALPLLAYQAKAGHELHKKALDHHEKHGEKLDAILKAVDPQHARYEVRDLMIAALKANRSAHESGKGDKYWNGAVDAVATTLGIEIV